jgi:DNA-binding HxlR family transcriptional regulator
MSPAPSKDHCVAAREVLNRVGDKWSVYVVASLSRGPVRFNALKRMIDGISQRMLTFTLKSLEQDGIVTRTVYLTVPARVDYELTELGRTLLVPVRALVRWAEKHRPDIDAARAKFQRAQEKKTARLTRTVDRASVA